MYPIGPDWIIAALVVYVATGPLLGYGAWQMVKDLDRAKIPVILGAGVGPAAMSGMLLFQYLYGTGLAGLAIFTVGWVILALPVTILNECVDWGRARHWEHCQSCGTRV